MKCGQNLMLSVNTILNDKQLLGHFLTRIVDDASNTNMPLWFIKIWAC